MCLSDIGPTCSACVFAAQQHHTPASDCLVHACRLGNDTIGGKLRVGLSVVLGSIFTLSGLVTSLSAFYSFSLLGLKSFQICSVLLIHVRLVANHCSGCYSLPCVLNSLLVLRSVRASGWRFVLWQIASSDFGKCVCVCAMCSL